LSESRGFEELGSEQNVGIDEGRDVRALVRAARETCKMEHNVRPCHYKGIYERLGAAVHTMNMNVGACLLKQNILSRKPVHLDTCGEQLSRKLRTQVTGYSADNRTAHEVTPCKIDARPG
jgi:hypothetical protein